MVKATGQPASTVTDWLTGEEKFFTAEEAQAAGLVDRVVPALVETPKNYVETLADRVRPNDEQLGYELCVALSKLNIPDKSDLRSWLQPLLDPAGCEVIAAAPGVLP